MTTLTENPLIAMFIAVLSEEFANDREAMSAIDRARSCGDNQAFLAHIEPVALRSCSLTSTLLALLTIRSNLRHWSGSDHIFALLSSQDLSLVRGAEKHFRLGRARMLTDTGAADRAQEDWDWLIERGGDCAHLAYTHLGLFALEAGEIEKSLECLARSCATRHVHWAPYGGMSDSLFTALRQEGVRDPRLDEYARLMATVPRNSSD